MYQVKEMTDEEQIQMYRDTLTFDQLAMMHVELLKHIPEPQGYSAEVLKDNNAR